MAKGERRWHLPGPKRCPMASQRGAGTKGPKPIGAQLAGARRLIGQEERDLQTLPQISTDISDAGESDPPPPGCSTETGGGPAKTFSFPKRDKRADVTPHADRETADPPPSPLCDSSNLPRNSKTSLLSGSCLADPDPGRGLGPRSEDPRDDG
ncbi:unnamed protein product [Merluccius merluccius]